MNDLIKEIHENAKAHGWWNEERSFGEIIDLCHSELSKALDEYRNNMPNIYCGDDISYGGNCTSVKYGSCKRLDGDCGSEKPEGIAIKLADCIIRILDYCGHAGIDMDEAIRIKHEYNKTRPFKHGGKVI